MVKLEQSVVNFVQIKHYFVATECMIQLDVCGLLLNFTENSIETSQTNRSVNTSKFLSLTVFLFVCLFVVFCSSSKIIISKVIFQFYNFG